MESILKLLFLVCMIVPLHGCEKKHIIGHTAKCFVEYIDDNRDGINDYANVTLSIMLNDGSTVNYTSTSVYWDGNLVLSAGELPVYYTQKVDVSEDSTHEFSFRCEWSGDGGTNIGAGMLPVLVENGEVSADYIVIGNNRKTIR